jgi:hypothetical protein
MLLLRSPTWLFLTIGGMIVTVWIGKVVGWRIMLAIPGFLLSGVGLFVIKAGMTPQGWSMVGGGFVLAMPSIIDEVRRERAARKLADAERVTPIRTSS